MAEGKVHDEMEKSDTAASSWPPAVTEQERNLAQQATSEFKSGNYSDCLLTLVTLAGTRSQDLKLTLNKAVAEYYRSGLMKTNEFKRALNDINSKLSLEEVSSVYDNDQCFLYYNQAVILYHMRQYRAALSILEKLVPVIEDLDNSLLEKIPCFLFSLHIATMQPDKALNLINHVEKNIITISTKPSNLEKEEAMKDDAESSRPAASGASKRDPWRTVVCQYRVRCYLMLKLLKPAKSTLKVLLGLVGMTSNIMFLKSHFELLRGNYQKAVRVLNSSRDLLMSKSAETLLMIMYYNDMGVIHFNMHKPNMALYYIKEAVDRNTAQANEMKKYDNKDPTDQVRGSIPCRPLQSLSGDQYYILLYNMGINLLRCGRPLQAFDCLLETIQIYNMNPRLWLRLAECCVGANRQSNEEDCKLSKKLEVLERAVGSGVHHKLVFGSGVLEDLSNTTESGAMPNATMEFASLCLDNALLCLETSAKLLFDSAILTQTAPSKQESSEASKSVQSVYIQALPGNPLSSDEVANLKCSILALKSYVSLCLNDHLIALAYAEELSIQPHLSGVHRYLANMYKAEALVELDRISDAISNLNPEVITDISAAPNSDPSITAEKVDKNDRAPSDPPEDKCVNYPWYPKDVTQAKGIMMYNLAVTYGIRGEYEKASNNLAKSKVMAGQPLPTQMYFLKIYLELLQGNRKSVQTLIKDHFGHMTINRL